MIPIFIAVATFAGTGKSWRSSLDGRAAHHGLLPRLDTAPAETSHTAIVLVTDRPAL
jgi:hypothetical protein